MKKMFRKILKKSASELKMELARAHCIIALLSLALIALVSLGSSQSITFDPTLSAICVVLLVLVALMSLCTATTLYRDRK